MQSESLYICNRCKKKYSINNIKYDRWGKLTCVQCLGEAEPAEKIRMERPELLKTNFICVNCRYKFRVSREAAGRPICPYCGKSSITQVKRYKDENDLIRDASDSKYDF